MEHRQRQPCHAGTLPAGTVAPGSVPVPAARHRNGEQTATAHDMHRDAPGAADRTASADRRPEQQRTTRRRPGLFLLPRLHPPATCPACRISSPARAGRCAAPGKSWKVPGERWAQYPDITPTACTGKDRHRQRRTDDPAAHKLHSLHTLPDLTAASSPPPAPTDTAPRKPCRPPAAADHPANSQKPPTAARRRRGQILYLTGIWPLQYSQ